MVSFRKNKVQLCSHSKYCIKHLYSIDYQFVSFNVDSLLINNTYYTDLYSTIIFKSRIGEINNIENCEFCSMISAGTPIYSILKICEVFM